MKLFYKKGLILILITFTFSINLSPSSSSSTQSPSSLSSSSLSLSSSSLNTTQQTSTPKETIISIRNEFKAKDVSEAKSSVGTIQNRLTTLKNDIKDQPDVLTAINEALEFPPAKHSNAVARTIFLGSLNAIVDKFDEKTETVTQVKADDEDKNAADVSRNLINELLQIDEKIKQLRQSDKKASRGLPYLNNAQMLAGLCLDDDKDKEEKREETFKYYHYPPNFGVMHERGNVMPANALEDIFLKTVFQYYTYEFLGYYINYKEQYAKDIQNYNSSGNVTWEQYLTSKGTETKAYWDTLASKFEEVNTDYNEAKNVTSSIDNAIQAFKQNIQLKKLGGAFQRRKVVLEKMRSWSSRPFYSDKYQYNDMIPTGIQTIIYNWIKEGYKQFIKNYNDEKTQPEAFIESFIPSFIEQKDQVIISTTETDKLEPYVYYKTIYKCLDHLCKPVRIISTREKDKTIGYYELQINSSFLKKLHFT